MDLIGEEMVMAGRKDAFECVAKGGRVGGEDGLARFNEELGG